MSLTVLSVAYPFAPVDADPVGGAEQIVARLDRAILDAGGQSVVVAAEGSKPSGRLVPVPQPAGELTPEARGAVQSALRQIVRDAIGRHRPDVVHLHGVDFDRCLPLDDAAPVLVTLHLPLDWYAPAVLECPGARVWLAPVSRDQVRRGPPGVPLLPPIENGVDVDAVRPCRKRRYAVALGRICPEKGFHLALDAARQAGLPMLLAGAVFPYREHQSYFDREIAPRLDAQRRWIGPVAGPAKQRLLAAAACLVVPSLAPETSSLVAREALAAGTPVAGLRNGALVDAVEPGRTGVLADTPKALPDAIRLAAALDPEECRRVARARFSAQRMVDQYLEIYRRLAAGEQPVSASDAA